MSNIDNKEKELGVVGQIDNITKEVNIRGSTDTDDHDRLMGIMMEAAYDSNRDGKVNAADKADSIAWSGITGKPPGFNPENHKLVDAVKHSVSGLTAGHFLKATGTTTCGFAEHGLTYTDVGAAPANQGIINGNSHQHASGDGAPIDHAALSNKGNSTHTQIDAHIASMSNPHNVTAAQVLPSQTDNSGKYLTTNGVNVSWATISSQPASTFVECINIKMPPYNAKGDGITDDTAAIQAAINDAVSQSINKVCIPHGTYLINPANSGTTINPKSGIVLQSNITLELDTHATLVMKPLHANNYAFMTIDGKTNVTIRGGKIIGDKESHPDSWGFNNCYGLLLVNGASNIIVENIEITNCKDDAMMIIDYSVATNQGLHCNNVNIRNVDFHHNGRQGLSICSGYNIQVRNSEFSYQQGHAPESGIDIECEAFDRATFGIHDVVIDNCQFIQNNRYGLIMSNTNPFGLKNIKTTNNEVVANYGGIYVMCKVDNLICQGNHIEIGSTSTDETSAIGGWGLTGSSHVITGNIIKATNSAAPFSACRGITTRGAGAVISNNNISNVSIGIKVAAATGTPPVIDNNAISYTRTGAVNVIACSAQITNNVIFGSNRDQFAADTEQNKGIIVENCSTGTVSVMSNMIKDISSYAILVGYATGTTDKLVISNNTIENVGRTDMHPADNCFIMWRDNNNLAVIKANVFIKGTKNIVFNYGGNKVKKGIFTNNIIQGLDTAEITANVNVISRDNDFI